MALIQGPEGDSAVVERDAKALRVVPVSRGVPQNYSGMTGTMAAALGANSPIWMAKLDASSAARAFFDRMRLQFTTIVAFTTPITAGRRLAVFRGSASGALTLSGGTAVPAVTPKHSNAQTSEMNTANGGDVRIATTGALTATGVTWEANPLATMSLSHVGAAGGFAELLFSWDGDLGPIVLEPGQFLAVMNPQAMDAAGTWQLGINVDWREAGLLTDTH
jgi:hypothetical protein